MVLVGVGDPPAGALVERLVVPEPDRTDAEQLCCRLTHPRMEHERCDIGVVLPQVDALHERLLVPGLLLERCRVVTGASGATGWRTIEAVGGRLFRYAAIASASVRDKFEYERQGMAGASSRPSGRVPCVIAMTMSLTDHFPSPV